MKFGILIQNIKNQEGFPNLNFSNEIVYICIYLYVKMFKLQTGITISIFRFCKFPLLFHSSQSPLFRSCLHLKILPLVIE